MNIDYTELNPTNHSRPNSAHAVDNKSDVNKKDVQQKRVPDRDEAELSDMARVMSKIHAELEDAPEIRAELVEELRSKIESGSYQIPLDELVNRLISGAGSQD